MWSSCAVSVTVMSIEQTFSGFRYLEESYPSHTIYSTNAFKIIPLKSCEGITYSIGKNDALFSFLVL